MYKTVFKGTFCLRSSFFVCAHLTPVCARTRPQPNSLEGYCAEGQKLDLLIGLRRSPSLLSGALLCDVESAVPWLHKASLNKLTCRHTTYITCLFRCVPCNLEWDPCGTTPYLECLKSLTPDSILVYRLFSQDGVESGALQSIFS